MKTKEVLKHIKRPIDYSATKVDLVKACDSMSNVLYADRKWFERTLPERTYKPPEEVRLGYLGYTVTLALERSKALR
jgi:hypothetical protein